VIHVRIVKGRKESICSFITAFRVLLVEDGLATLKLANCLLVWQGFLSVFYQGQLLDGDSPKAFKDFFEVHLLVGLLMGLQVFKPGPKLV
jgi:hypothetical protein